MFVVTPDYIKASFMLVRMFFEHIPQHHNALSFPPFLLPRSPICPPVSARLYVVSTYMVLYICKVQGLQMRGSICPSQTNVTP